MKKHTLFISLLALILIVLSGCQSRPEPQTTPIDHVIQSKVNPIDGAVMVFVPEGEFLMGDDDGSPDQRPAHMVYLDAFWIYQTEVTNQQYRQCIQAGACQGNLAFYPENDYPANETFRWMGQSYCNWAGGRLPTEAEWEKAARGTDGRKFPWGNEPVTGERANFCDVNCDEPRPDRSQDDGYATIAPVGSYPLGASPYGALDMAGNVWEWVADGYDEEYYSKSPYNNPTGPKDFIYDTMRGGSWAEPEYFQRVTVRQRNYLGMLFDNLGFRCVQSD